MLPADAEIASDILQEALADTVLSAGVPPYSYECMAPTEGFLNPDLCLKWVKGLLESQGSLERVEKDIHSLLPHCALEGFCDKYSILISHLWEHSMYEWNEATRYTRCVDATMTSHAVRDKPTTAGTSQSPGTTSYLPSAQSGRAIQHTTTHQTGGGRDLRVDQEYAGVGALTFSPRSPSPPSPKLVARIVKERPYHYHPKEHEYMKYLMISDKKGAAAFEKFQARFPGTHRNENSVRAEIVRLRQHILGTEPLQRSLIPWTPEEVSHLKKLCIQGGHTWKEIAQQMEAEFHKGRPVSSYTGYAAYKSFDVSKLTTDRPPDWTEEHDELVRLYKEKGTSSQDLSRLFKEKFGIDRSVDAIRRRCGLKSLAPPKKVMPWTKQQMDSLWHLCRPGSNLTRAEVHRKFWDRFGNDRSGPSIDHKRREMQAAGGPPADVPVSDAYTAAEEQFLLKSMRDAPGKVPVVALNAKFGTNRSRGSVNTKCSTLKQRTTKV